MIRKLNIILLSILLSTGLVNGQTTTSLTLKECREMAIKANYNLKSSREKVTISEDMLAAYKTNNLPNVSLSGEYLYSTISFSATIPGGYLPTFTDNVINPTTFAYMPDTNFELDIESIYKGGVMITQPIYMGKKISNAIKLSSLALDISKLDVKKSEADVIVLADEAFYKVLEVEELLLASKRYETVVAEFYRQMESGYKNGMKRRNDLLKVEVRLNEAKLMVQKATNALRLSKMNLCYVIGLPLTNSDISLTDYDEINRVIDDNDLDITSRPEYSMLEKQVIAKELEAKISRSDFLPSVAAVASYNYITGSKLNNNTLLGGADFSGLVTMKVPIFHWGEGKRKISAKRREVTIAKNQMEDLTQKMTLELLQAANSYNESLLEVELCNGAVAQSEENMRLSKNQYDAGMETIADYLESQALWQKAMSDLCSAKSKRRVAYTRYLKAEGDSENRLQ